VTRTRRAAAFVWDAKVLMPSLPDLGLVFQNETGQSFCLALAEPNARRRADGPEPELRQFPFTHDVHVRRLRAVA
jgi:hypothetical protein